MKKNKNEQNETTSISADVNVTTDNTFSNETATVVSSGNTQTNEAPADETQDAASEDTSAPTLPESEQRGESETVAPVKEVIPGEMVQPTATTVESTERADENKTGVSNEDSESESEQQPQPKKTRKPRTPKPLSSEPVLSNNLAPAAAAPATNSAPIKNIAANYISGAMLVMLVDLLVPAALKFVIEKAKEKEVDIRELKLTPQEQKDIAPLANEVVKELFSTMSPTEAFFLFLFVMYGGKAMFELAD